MDKQPFPFRNACFISFSKDWKRYAPLEVEEAVTDPEIYQALNYRSLLQFRKPLLLHFNKFDVQTPVWFGFSFDVEVIVTPPTFPLPLRKPTTILWKPFLNSLFFCIPLPI